MWFCRLIAKQYPVVGKKFVREDLTPFPQWFDDIGITVSLGYSSIKLGLSDPPTFLVDVHGCAYLQGMYGIPEYIVTASIFACQARK